ncbi:MAG TPA: LutB/LldF family L-lactate oxidation iron-sulfur protein [Desulfomonilaceae bacterium]|nr:LutB/LldF family L-lactate oxidation iron-sulfur protein [Desulfomonilaceae bacterium]
MKHVHTPINFRENAITALQDKALRKALRKAMDLFIMARAVGVSGTPLETWREKASAIRMRVLDDLPAYLDTFSANATKAGAVVYRAKDAQTANDIVFNILKDRGARRIVKSKSMVTEEIGLNEYLLSRDMSVVETDLGEYIVQLAGEPPSHILGPALHKDRQQIGRLFQQKLGVRYTEDVSELIKIARNELRTEFFRADAGISGANFAVSDSGSLVIFTNEGNGRMVTTLPPLHVAVLSIEKMIPSLSDLPTFIRLLPRSASGQTLSSYMSVITGTRKLGELTGAKELHIVLVDNGRFKILAGECREILKCIRCSACLNICPVYRVVGGHAYGSTYPGPMGVVLTTLLNGMDEAHSLLDATTLCGACAEVCPVQVPLPKLLSTLREKRVIDGFTPAGERAAMSVLALAMKVPAVFNLGQIALRFVWPLLQGTVANGRFSGIDPPAKKNFRRRVS